MSSVRGVAAHGDRQAATAGPRTRGARRLTAARGVLAQINDPEIPSVPIVEMGIVRDVREEGDDLVVEILPTFSGCPALEVIQQTVRAAILDAGLGPLRLVTRTDLPWSTAMITETGQRRLREFGIVPPQRKLKAEDIACLNCGQRQVVLVSRFGATPCRATARCRACGEPLEVFKPIGVEP
ncbi:MAG TPA: 1,2-phenylacetyl-CoA epoxidase subunit PaaD [Candidatus Dormibacteraeota bacterium]|nr:1,2-phenylacetyl-CoA epoxidase subunit PaaD [Candidatus Dormibacteraeota bacterium]